MDDNIFERLTDEQSNLVWAFMILNRDLIIAKAEQWTKEAEAAGLTLREYLESISPLKESEDEECK